MRKMKAKFCLDCKFHSLSGECSEILICAKGHKPRFYKPVGRYPFYREEANWKRRCEDFEPEKRKYVEVII